MDDFAKFENVYDDDDIGSEKKVRETYFNRDSK